MTHENFRHIIIILQMRWVYRNLGNPDIILQGFLLMAQSASIPLRSNPQFSIDLNINRNSSINLQSSQVAMSYSGVNPSNIVNDFNHSSSGQLIALPQSQLPFTAARHTEHIIGAPAKQIEWRFKERVRLRIV